ncbi:YfhO family protein [Patescibacteria group bacterium]
MVLFFFHRLFIPRPSLFYTPDFGQSDIWNFNYPIKDFLSISLKQGSLPFWSKDIATGFPFFAEGQIGTLNFFNLILFFLLPTWLAWNISYIIIFSTAFAGTFLFFKKNLLSDFASFFGGVIFSLSGFFVCHISHFNLIQAASFLPWLFLAAQNLLQKGSKANILFFAVIFSQQIFSGHPQISFISIFGLGLFILFNLFQKTERGNIFTKIKSFATALIFGLLLSAPQLLATFQLAKRSIRQSGLDPGAIFQYPYPLIHLITFILPNYFGSPKNGTYPPFNQNWGIYWENTAYLGIIPIILLAFFLFRKNKKHTEKFFLFLVFLSLFLVWGNNSPLYFIFTFPVFSFFRVPSRFLLLTAFAIAFIASSSLDRITISWEKIIRTKSIVLTLTILFTLTFLFDLFYFGYLYHPLIPVKEALKPPPSADIIAVNERIYTDSAQPRMWNKHFINQGWGNINPYLYYKNGLDADLNLLFGKSHIKAFYGLPTKRQQYFQQYLNENLVNISAVKKIIYLDIIDNPNLELIKTLDPPTNDLPKYYIYQNLNSLNRFRFASEYQIEKTTKGLLLALSNKSTNFENTVILESDPGVKFESLDLKNIEVKKNTDQKIILETATDKDTILVIADSFYPEWKAKIDGKKTKIIPANLNQKAIILPKGNHHIELYYWPKSFIIGLIITSCSICIFLVIKKPNKSKL